MPTHKGIKMSIISQWELRIHPEFPHPESSQFTNRGSPNNRNSASFVDINPKTIAASPDSKADRLLGRQSSVSVYIPSIAGARFWLRYSVADVAPNSPWYYFKLFMNGRHITSWGINTQKKPSGQVMRALFDPSERWNYKQDGIKYKNNGTESRPFFFNNDLAGLTAGDDGGLIEVQVFRARGRQRKLADPVEFKSQDQYGIVMPSGGLLDKPQDAKFYDWHLKDPKDRPFTIFKFHYRSWDSLMSLQLIPDDHPRCLLLPSPSILSLNGHPTELQEIMDEERRVRVIPADEVQLHSPRVSPNPKRRDSASSNSSVSTPWMTTVFDDSSEVSVESLDNRVAFLIPSMEGNHPVPKEPRTQVLTTRFSQGAIPRAPPKMKRRPLPEVFGRPLPEIPTRGGSSKHSRNTSTASCSAASITPSLLPYLERDTVSPPPIIGVAALFPIGRAIDEAHEDELEENQVDNGKSLLHSENMFEDPDLKPEPLSTGKRHRTSSSPLSGFFSLPNVTLRKGKKSPYRGLPKLLTSPDINNYGVAPLGFSSTSKEDEEQDVPGNMTSLSLTESEWMCRTPSPVVNDPDCTRLEKLWTPGVGKKDLAGKAGGSLRKKAMDWYENVRNPMEPESPSTASFGDVKIKSGDWI